jgi:hypothetical protein
MMDDESIRQVALSKPWKGEVSTVFLGFAAPGTEGDDKIPHLWETLVAHEGNPVLRLLTIAPSGGGLRGLPRVARGF